MGRIKILNRLVSSQMAAGEVIERPVGAVKEIVENSIDAGANRITIEIVNGGLDLIAVRDNGCGMYEEDIPLAFVNHATSKLSSIAELYAMQTLGFRGEALSSIAAVSRVKLTTRRSDMDSAVCVTVENGEVVDKQYVAANVGTTIEVRNLFYNVPARHEYIKAPSKEGTEITRFVSKLILTNPNLEISYYSDGKKIYETKGKGLEKAIYTVYGEKCLNSLLPVIVTRNNMSLYGYIGTPEYTKPNKLYQTISINGRFITDGNIAGAVLQAYKQFLMTRQYPFYVLNLEIPCNLVDVNIHPKKAEVRFARPQEVFSIFYHGIQDTMNSYVRKKADEMLLKDKEISDDDKTSVLSRKEWEDVAKKVLSDDSLDTMSRDQKKDVISIEKETEEVERRQSIFDFARKMEKEITVEKARKSIGLDFENVAQSTAVVGCEDQAPLRIVEETHEEKHMSETDELFLSARILGAAFKTYLILELDDKIIFVDQHAAHERILFEKFIESHTKDMQPLMFPYIFTVRDEEAAFIDQNRENIFNAGIDIEPFGHNTYRISAVSPLLADTKMSDFVNYLLSGIDEFKLDDKQLIVEKIARKACKAAVKAGANLNEYEIKYILKEVRDNRILQCPHGRPITVIFTKSQFEKMFKRTV